MSDGLFFWLLCTRFGGRLRCTTFSLSDLLPLFFCPPFFFPHEEELTDSPWSRRIRVHSSSCAVTLVLFPLTYSFFPLPANHQRRLFYIPSQERFTSPQSHSTIFWLSSALFLVLSLPLMPWRFAEEVTTSSLPLYLRQFSPFFRWGLSPRPSCSGVMRMSLSPRPRFTSQKLREDVCPHGVVVPRLLRQMPSLSFWCSFFS